MAVETYIGNDWVDAAARAIERLAPRSLSLAGASTPRPVYERLREAAWDWPAVDVFFGDERCVPPDHPDSNYRMAAETWLSHVPARVHRMPGETCDAEAYETTLRDRLGPDVPVLDLAILGIGDDGHTASLFPGDAALEEQERLVVGVERPDYHRLTLTLPVLSAARVACFLIAGAAKREALGRLLDGDRSIPAARVDAQEVWIFADEAAAGR